MSAGTASTYRCELCDITLSWDQLQIHQAGAKHAKALKRHEKAEGAAAGVGISVEAVKPFWCAVCEIQLTSTDQLADHKRGQKHRKKEALKKDSLPVQSTDESERKEQPYPAQAAEDVARSANTGNSHPGGGVLLTSGESNAAVSKEAGPWICIPCNYNATSQQHLGAHLQGKKHKKRLLQQDAGAIHDYFCYICNIPASCQDALDDHMRGKQHMKNVKRASDNPADLYCNICKISTGGREQYEAHCNGKAHLRKCESAGKPTPVSALRKTPEPRSHSQPINLEFGAEPRFLTKTKPRDYQEELYKQALQDNRVLYLPTGMGKTLLGTCVLSRMLQLNPSYQVVFLVDRVILVVQQAEAIRQELGDVRLPGNKAVRVAALCGGKEDLEENMPPGSGCDHDIVVATAGCYRNLLKSKCLFWQDVSCLVIDEVHHCGKRHPFNTILTSYYHCPDAHKPRLIGLTASPAGHVKLDATLKQLNGLLDRMNAKLGTVIHSRQSYDSFLRRAALRCAIVDTSTGHIDETLVVEAKMRKDDVTPAVTAFSTTTAAAASSAARDAAQESEQQTGSLEDMSQEEQTFYNMLRAIEKYMEEALRAHSGCGRCGKDMIKLNRLLSNTEHTHGYRVRDTMVTVFSLVSRYLCDPQTEAKCKAPLRHLQSVARSWLDINKRRSIDELKKLTDCDLDYGFKKAFPKLLKTEAFIMDYFEAVEMSLATSSVSKMSVSGNKNILSEDSDELDMSDLDDPDDYLYSCADEESDDDDLDIESYGEDYDSEDYDEEDGEPVAAGVSSDITGSGEKPKISSASKAGTSTGGDDDDDESEESKRLAHQKIVEELAKLPWHQMPKPIALVLVEKRKEALETMEALNAHELLQEKGVRALQIIGQNSTPTAVGMTVKKQTDAMEALRRGAANVAVCTSVAEEGLDLPSCSLVIRTKLPRTVPSLVQSWGRARACGATFFVLCLNMIQQEKVHLLLAREENMERAAKYLVEKGLV